MILYIECFTKTYPQRIKVDTTSRDEMSKSHLGLNSFSSRDETNFIILSIILHIINPLKTEHLLLTVKKIEILTFCFSEKKIMRFNFWDLIPGSKCNSVYTLKKLVFVPGQGLYTHFLTVFFESHPGMKFHLGPKDRDETHPGMRFQLGKTCNQYETFD